MYLCCCHFHYHSNSTGWGQVSRSGSFPLSWRLASSSRHQQNFVLPLSTSSSSSSLSSLSPSLTALSLLPHQRWTVVMFDRSHQKLNWSHRRCVSRASLSFQRERRWVWLFVTLSMTILDESSQCPRKEKGKVLAVARTNLLVSNMLVINTMVSRGCSSAPGWLVFSHSRLLSPMFCLRFKFLKMHPLGFLILTNSQFLIIVMQVIIALGVVFFVFKIPCDGPVPLFVLLCLLQGDDGDEYEFDDDSSLCPGVVGMSYGFFLSTVCDTTADAMKMAISSFFPVLMVIFMILIGSIPAFFGFSSILSHILWQVCGVIWPLEGMPYQWLQQLAWFLPQTASIQVLTSRHLNIVRQGNLWSYILKITQAH